MVGHYNRAVYRLVLPTAEITAYLCGGRDDRVAIVEGHQTALIADFT
jgi:hypothetical protein